MNLTVSFIYSDYALYVRSLNIYIFFTFFHSFIELWGLDAEGRFLTDGSNLIKEDSLRKLISFMSSKRHIDVKELILHDLKNVMKTIETEDVLLRMKKASNKEIGRRLLFLFQCDLLPGISGKILELKGSRDNPKVLQKSKMIKLIGWCALLLLNLLMLFYILLFAFSQTGPRQSAWFKSFAIWLAMEIIIVSTSIVLISHVFIPIMIMKDLAQIKKKLIANIREYQDTIKYNKKNGINDDVCDNQNNDNFNAAKYLFISTGLSKLYPDVKESKIIAQFSTPWPKQSYCRVKDVSKQYSKKFSALTRSASILIIFFAGQFLNMPSGFQDVIIHVSSTAAMGYVILVHIQLYQLFPALVILPVCIIGIIVHFIITSGKADAKLRLAKLFPVNPPNNNDHVVDKQQSRIVAHKDLPSSSSSKVNIHQTRRASLQLGLSVIDEIEQIDNSGSEESSSVTSDDDNDDDEDDDDEDDGDNEERDDDDDDDKDSHHEDSDDGDDDDQYHGSGSGTSKSDNDNSNYYTNSENESNSNYGGNVSARDSVSCNIDVSTDNDGDGDNNMNNKNKNEHGSNCNDDNAQSDVHSEHSSVDSMKVESLPDQLLLVVENSVMDGRGYGSYTERIVACENSSIWLESISDREDDDKEEDDDDVDKDSYDEYPVDGDDDDQYHGIGSRTSNRDNDNSNYYTNSENENNSNYGGNVSAIDSVSCNIEVSTDSHGDGVNNMNNKNKNESGSNCNDDISQSDVHSEHI